MSELAIAMSIGFLAGVVVGMGGLAVYLTTVVKKQLQQFYNANKDIIDRSLGVPPSEPTINKELQDSVNQRLMKAQQITQQQNQIVASLEMPSASAAHSKHKNAMGMQLKELEKEKMTLLRSIVNDGVDPTIVVFNTATRKQEQVLLSQFLDGFVPDPTGSVAAANAPKTDTKAEPPPGVRKVEKNGKTFFVIDGGKKDPTNH